mmetsp:Transcript_7263/g.25968  ORF Transcript_7263/g.25968 Transcript_7263/m.25968 type:complete len:118 (-) Transcript_7263:124-477(-)
MIKIPLCLGITATVDIFIAAALATKRARNLAHAIVHPIVPVLKETRAVVRKYNARLRQRVLQEPELRWLDFFDGLLEGLLEEDELKASYALDGTHLDPRYLQELLAPKLAAILREQA